jgi:Per os infectivity
MKYFILSFFILIVIGFVFIPSITVPIINPNTILTQWKDIVLDKTKTKLCDPTITNPIACNINDPKSCSSCYESNTKCIKVPSLHIIDRNIKTKLNASNGICIPLNNTKYSNKCTATTSDAILTKVGDKYNFICKCKYPSIVTQLTPESDCNIPIACRPHGHLNHDFMMSDPKKEGYCECQFGYTNSRTNEFGPFCRESQAHELPPCYNASLDSESLIKLNHENIGSLQSDQNSRCFNDPCQVDPQTQQTNRNCYMTRFRNEIGNICRCDPSFGYFPVNGSFSMLKAKSDAPSGCMNIFNTPAPNTQFEEKCNFRVDTSKKLPDCTLTFKNVTFSSLSPIFKSAVEEKFNQNPPIIIPQITLKLMWPYTFTNILVNENKLGIYNHFALLAPDLKKVMYEAYDQSPTLLWNPIIRKKENTCLTLKNTDYHDSLPVERKSNIPQCSSDVLFKAHNIAKVYYGQKTFDPSLKVHRTLIKSKLYEWNNYLYFPYCILNENLVINPHILNDGTCNKLIDTTSVLNNDGLQHPIFNDNPHTSIVELTEKSPISTAVNLEWEGSQNESCWTYKKPQFIINAS